MTLPDYIQGKMQAAFEWGVNDCMTFTVGWIEIATGKKYLPSTMWKSELQAARIVKKHGGLENVFDKEFSRINPNYANDGDITVCNGVASIFSGRHVVSVGKEGIAHKPRSQALCAWRIECLQ